ncbi:RNA polymerase sigma factor [Arthrospiribacter ruber]|uniref:Sigma-70 family RNA polymerase sigma factor n=1 Tax=Arthrospiribacter ruber TaxID=2487934 RepID=A0A951J016_9BACT|nr:sigma-70 family RNA polymerase sigma factor [Arthrospiribacter ruber]MBW3469499.1 sigma-70 family RNA polymerase sigma factor [Arthrospiribacter ruber]
MNNLIDTEVRSLVTLVKAGDEKSYTRLFDMFAPKLIHTAQRMHVSKEDAEGMAQEIFLFIWKKREQLNPELSFNAYLLTILKSKLYRQIKADARKIAFQKYAIHFSENLSVQTENQVNFDELVEISSKVIEKLPKQQKQIFLWKGFENFSSDEIAKKLGLSKRTVENHFYQASKKLRAEVEKEYQIPIKKLFMLIMTFISNFH